jgi:hypothetical protein
MNKYQIIHCNAWDVWVVLFTGSKEQCETEYEKRIGYYESIDATITKKG